MRGSAAAAVEDEETEIQTFVPYADYRNSATILDDRRLGKQRVETLQILHVLLGLRTDPDTGVIAPYEPRGWRTHPAELMWKGVDPPWLGDAELHRSHQSNLIRKDPTRYGPLFPGVPDDLPDVWPVRVG